MSARPLRRDAQDNRQRLLAAATLAVKREGLKVPIATIAADAGVGVGTLYRHFPDRADLLAALTERSFGLVLVQARAAAEADGAAIDAVAAFLEATIGHRAELVLPLHGGPATLDARSAALRDAVHAQLRRILRRGRDDGTVRADLTAADLVVFGAMLAQPLPHVADWDRVARRQARIFLAGLGA